MGTHLWPRMAGDQAGQLQRLALADGVHPLRVAFLLDVAGQARVHDPHRGGGCKTQREKPGEHLHPRATPTHVTRTPSWHFHHFHSSSHPAHIRRQKRLPPHLLTPSNPLNETFANSFALHLFLFPFPNEICIIMGFFIIYISKCITLLMQMKS